MTTQFKNYTNIPTFSGRKPQPIVDQDEYYALLTKLKESETREARKDEELARSRRENADLAKLLEEVAGGRKPADIIIDQRKIIASYNAEKQWKANLLANDKLDRSEKNVLSAVREIVLEKSAGNPTEPIVILNEEIAKRAGFKPDMTRKTTARLKINGLLKRETEFGTDKNGAPRSLTKYGLEPIALKDLSKFEPIPRKKPAGKPVEGMCKECSTEGMLYEVETVEERSEQTRTIILKEETIIGTARIVCDECGCLGAAKPIMRKVRTTKIDDTITDPKPLPLVLSNTPPTSDLSSTGGNIDEITNFDEQEIEKTTDDIRPPLVLSNTLYKDTYRCYSVPGVSDIPPQYPPVLVNPVKIAQSDMDNELQRFWDKFLTDAVATTRDQTKQNAYLWSALSNKLEKLPPIWKQRARELELLPPIGFVW